MCTTISETTSIQGAGKGVRGWFPLSQATVAYDHATHTGAEHALLLDFTNYALGTEARVAVEMNVASGKAFLEQLRTAIEAAQASGLAE